VEFGGGVTVTVHVLVVKNGVRVTVLDGVGETDWVEVSVVVAILTVVVAAGTGGKVDNNVNVSQSVMVDIGLAGKTANLSPMTDVGPLSASTENARV
jgi:hypothetical protein